MESKEQIEKEFEETQINWRKAVEEALDVMIDIRGFETHYDDPFILYEFNIRIPKDKCEKINELLRING